MKNLVLFVAVVALASGAVIPKPSLRDAEILNTQEEAEEAVSRKHHVTFISGLGFVSHHSPVWHAVKDLDSEELADFVEELHSLHGDNKDEEETNVENDEGILENKQEEEEVEEAVSRKHHVTFISGLGFVSHHSPVWHAVKDLDSEELADFVAELHSLHADNKDEEETDVENDEGILENKQEEEDTANLTSRREKKVSFVSGLGFVSHNSPMWNAVKDLDSDELAEFVADLQNLHGASFYVETKTDEEKSQIEDLSRAKPQNIYGEIVPGLGFVNYHNPLWAIISKLDSEELKEFVTYLHGQKPSEDVEVNAISSSEQSATVNLINEDIESSEATIGDIEETGAENGLEESSNNEYVVKDTEDTEVTNDDGESTIDGIEETADEKGLEPSNSSEEITPSEIVSGNTEDTEAINDDGESTTDDFQEVNGEKQSSSSEKITPNEITDENTEDTETINDNGELNFDNIEETAAENVPDQSNSNEELTANEIVNLDTDDMNAINNYAESTIDSIKEPMAEKGLELEQSNSDEKLTPIEIIGNETDDMDVINYEGESTNDGIEEIVAENELEQINSSEELTSDEIANEYTEDTKAINDDRESTIDDFQETVAEEGALNMKRLVQ